MSKCALRRSPPSRSSETRLIFDQRSYAGGASRERTERTDEAVAAALIASRYGHQRS